MITDHWDVGLIPCTKAKKPTGINARTLYRGGTFSLLMRHAHQRCDKVMIMSAKYGLVDLDHPMQYYDQFVDAQTTQERLELLAKVRGQIQELKGLRVISYLWHSYHSILVEADPTIANQLRRPYKGIPTMPAYLQAIITREISNYGSRPSRR